MAFDVTLIIFEISGYESIADETTHEVASLLRRNTSLTHLRLSGIYHFYIINMILVTFFVLLL